MSAPPKERAAVLGPPIKKLAAQYYHRQDTAQVAPWWLEAERLGREFRRTHDKRHLQALARHLDGIFERLITAGVQ